MIYDDYIWYLEKLIEIEASERDALSSCGGGINRYVRLWVPYNCEEGIETGLSRGEERPTVYALGSMCSMYCSMLVKISSSRFQR